MSEKKVFDRRWFMCDLARQRVFVRDEFIMWLDGLARLGYNGLGIYLEGAFDFDSIPGVIREGVLTPDDAKWIVEEGRKRGIFVFPMTNVVGHMEHFFGQERNRRLKSDLSAGGDDMQMDFLHPDAEAFAMNIVHEYARHFNTGMVHIGGDETHLTPETKMDYARFLAKICDNLLAEGIKPAIWDDMIWMDTPLSEVFSREVFLFDWNYYGHRPESIAYFTEQGFKDIVVCPCDNSWEGIINFQRTSGHLKARTDMPVKPDEIEAFFDDASKQGLYGGLLTNWDNTVGRNMWAQWVPFARAALYMNGQWEAGSRNDEAIEKALFGRITPYTEVTYILQEKVQRPDLPQKWFHDMRDCLFVPANLSALILRAAKDAPSFPEDIDQALTLIDEKLAAWTPETPFEERCLAGMYGATAIVSAANKVLKAGRGYQRYYLRASEMQFISADVAAQLLGRLSGLFRSAAAEFETCALVFGAAVNTTGHAPNDVVFMRENACLLSRIADLIDSYIPTLSRIPLPRFERIIDRVIIGKPIL